MHGAYDDMAMCDGGEGVATENRESMLALTLSEFRSPEQKWCLCATISVTGEKSGNG